MRAGVRGLLVFLGEVFGLFALRGLPFSPYVVMWYSTGYTSITFFLSFFHSLISLFLWRGELEGRKAGLGSTTLTY